MKITLQVRGENDSQILNLIPIVDTALLLIKY